MFASGRLLIQETKREGWGRYLAERGLCCLPTGRRRELAAIYVKRGLEAELAKQVTQQLMAHDAFVKQFKLHSGDKILLRIML